jgi:2-methylisocitrate lyase-like PEP mutase family enzyme
VVRAIIRGVTATRATTELRRLLSGGDLLVAPGVYDGLSARLARHAGFAAVYATGGGIARGMGYPDLGLLGLTEVAERLAGIVEHAGVPVIADADTGYGNALNVRRTVRAFERAGVAALHLEDQTFPKRCGHLDEKSVVPVAEMVQKLRAARDAAGADVLFVEAPTSEAQIEVIARRLPGPKLLNMFEGGKTPLVPLARLQALGYRIVIIPSDLQRAAIRAMQDVLAAIRRDGNSHAVTDRMASFAERETIVGTADYLALDRRDAGPPPPRN